MKLCIDVTAGRVPTFRTSPRGDPPSQHTAKGPAAKEIIFQMITMNVRRCGTVKIYANKTAVYTDRASRLNLPWEQLTSKTPRVLIQDPKKSSATSKRPIPKVHHDRLLHQALHIPHKLLVRRVRVDVVIAVLKRRKLDHKRVRDAGLRAPRLDDMNKTRTRGQMPTVSPSIEISFPPLSERI